MPLGCALGYFDRSRVVRLSSSALYVLYALPVAAVAMLVLRAGAPWGARTVAGMLPAAACLALAETVKLARYQRGALLDALAADYVTTARAKGHGPRGVIAHALRNALLPTVTLLASELPALLSAAVIVEQVFGLHGIGMMAFDAVMTRDVPLLLGITTVGALVTLAAVLTADVAYGLVDPRLKDARRERVAPLLVDPGRALRARRARRRRRRGRVRRPHALWPRRAASRAASAPCSRRRRAPTGSAPTIAAATSPRAWSTARASPCSSARSPSRSTCSPACSSASPPRSAGAPTSSSAASSTSACCSRRCCVLLAIQGVTSSTSLAEVALAIALTQWPYVARLTRAEALRIATLPHVEAARAVGAGRARILGVHILPLAATPALTAAAFGIGQAVLFETALTFLGFGVPPPTASWGELLAQAQASGLGAVAALAADDCRRCRRPRLQPRRRRRAGRAQRASGRGCSLIMPESSPRSPSIGSCSSASASSSVRRTHS